MGRALEMTSPTRTTTHLLVIAAIQVDSYVERTNRRLTPDLSFLPMASLFAK